MLFGLGGDMRGLVLAPLARFGSTRAQREAHVYTSAFEVDATRRRIVLPYDLQSVPRVNDSRP